MTKKLLKSVAVVTVSLALAAGIAVTAACTDNTPEATEYTVTFDLNYENAPAASTQKVKEGEKATEPAAPSREGYTFDDWYKEAACTNKADFDAAITANVTYYAGWTQDTVDVTFVLYGEETLVQEVVPGNTVSQPAEPTRTDYLFEGWYADSDFETPFDFSAPITQATTVYANWIQADDDHVIVTYMLNYGDAGVFKRETLEKGTMLVTLPVASAVSREGYRLNGWYLDEGCTQAYSRTTLTENLTLYAGWDKGYVFEAEYTDLNDAIGEPRPFQGYSENMAGADAVAADATGTASNGYYIGGMYINGSYLYFDIESEAAVEGAVLTINLSVGVGFGNSVVFSPSMFAVKVNDVAVNYSDITIEYKPSGNLTYSNFAEFTLGNISLKEGANTIRLEVTNQTRGEGGTQDATAPLVDCITIYTDTELTWEPVTSNVR